jgi:Uma2 family endonuclease
MSVVSKQLITAEEFLRMPDPKDGSKQELVRGVIVTMPPPGGRHGACCSKIDRLLGNFIDDRNSGTVMSNDTGFITERDPDSGARPRSVILELRTAPRSAGRLHRYPAGFGRGGRVPKRPLFAHPEKSAGIPQSGRR